MRGCGQSRAPDELLRIGARPAPRGTAWHPDSPARALLSRCAPDIFTQQPPSPTSRSRLWKPGVPVPARASVRPMWSITTGRPICLQDRDRVRQVLHVDPELQVPAEVLHDRRELLRVLERHAAAVVQLPAAEEMIEAQRADAELVPAAQLGDRHRLVGDRHAAQPLRVPRQRVEHRRIVAAVRAALHQPAAREAQRIEHVQILLQRRVGRRVAAVGPVGKPGGRPEHMGVGVAGARRRLILGGTGSSGAGHAGIMLRQFLPCGRHARARQSCYAPDRRSRHRSRRATTRSRRAEDHNSRQPGRNCA